MAAKTHRSASAVDVERAESCSADAVLHQSGWHGFNLHFSPVPEAQYCADLEERMAPSIQKGSYIVLAFAVAIGASYIIPMIVRANGEGRPLGWTEELTIFYFSLFVAAASGNWAVSRTNCVSKETGIIVVCLVWVVVTVLTPYRLAVLMTMRSTSVKPVINAMGNVMMLDTSFDEQFVHQNSQTDIMVLLGLDTITTISCLFVQLRSSRNWVIPLFSTVFYVAFSAHSNLSAGYEDQCWGAASILILLGYCVWYGRYCTEKADRESWLEKRQLRSDVGVLFDAAEKLNLVVACGALVCDSVVAGDEAFIELFGESASFDRLCATIEDASRVKNLVETVQDSREARKLTVTFKSAGSDELIEATVLGVPVAKGVSIGVQVLDRWSIVNAEDAESVDDAESMVDDVVSIRVMTRDVQAVLDDEDDPNAIPDASSCGGSVLSRRSVPGSVVSIHSASVRVPCDAGTFTVQIRQGRLLSLMRGSCPSALTWASYQIEKPELTRESDAPIGTGAFGSCYKATYRSTFVVVKELERGLETSPVSKLMMQREVGNLMRLRHRNIVIMMGAVFDGNTLSIVMELCEGGSVASRIYTAKDMTYSAGRIILAQVAEAVAMVHSFDIVHRDIKSANVMLATRSLEDPLAKLGDFGASRESHDDAPPSPNMVGTPGFAPPDQYRRSHDCAVDVYAFGMLGYEICAMKSPIAAAAPVLKEIWRGRGKFGQVTEQQFMRTGIKNLYQMGWRPDVDGIPSRMAQVLTACWADNPKERMSMDGIVTELRRLSIVQLPAGHADIQVPSFPTSELPWWQNESSSVEGVGSVGWSDGLPPQLEATPVPVPGVFKNQAK